MKTKMMYNWLMLIAILGVLGCSQKHEESSVAESISNEESLVAKAPAPEEKMMKQSMSKEDAPIDKITSPSEEYMSSSAAVEKGGSSRKFIRTADIRFKTKNVIEATYQIENITVRHGGFVTESKLGSSIESTKRIDVSEDSTLQITHFTVNAFLTLRVPNTQLDTTLKDIALLVDFLDYRNITANDVALNILSNDLAQKRLTANERRLTNAIDNRGRKLEETTNAEELLLRTQERADNAKISNLSLNDQIDFSTITIKLYENKRTKKELIEREIQFKQYEYKQGLGSRLAEAFNGGWEMFCAFIIGISYLWWLFVLVALAVIAFKVYRKKKRK